MPVYGTAEQAARLRKSEHNLQIAVIRLTKFIALQVLRGAVLATRVDTGRARGNWVVSVGSPHVGHSENKDKGGGKTLTEGVRVISTAKAYAVIWLTNNVPYIEFLNRLDHILDRVLAVVNKRRRARVQL